MAHTALSFVQDNFSPARNPFAALMDTSDIPQFILLTVDSTVTSYEASLFRPLTTPRDRYGCGIRSTFYVSAKEETDCDLVNALRTGQHEIAINTYNNVESPNEEDIRRAMDHLHEQCGVPKEEIQGFRAPGLKLSEETLNHLHDLGFEYDSSMVTMDHRGSNYGRSHIWPFTFDQGANRYTTCGCNLNLTDAGLWEVPVWTQFGADGLALRPMDYSGADPIGDLNTNFERRYNGNRAPLGVFLNSGYLQQHSLNLKQWIEDIQNNYDDVHFITTSELIEYMRNPVKKRRYRQFCTDQQSECYTPIPLQCLFGDFNVETCECECNAGYCHDADGICSRSQNCFDTDGGWSEWESAGSCCDGLQMLSRTCTNPAPEGNGADCEGDSTMFESCYPNNCERGGWSEWGEWSECCGLEHTRSRTCLASPSANGGAGCLGDSIESEKCGPDTCQRAYYPEDSLEMCVRHAHPPEGFVETQGHQSFEECCEENFQTRLAPCYDKSANPPQNGGWSEWTVSGPCCDGKQTISRTCTEPAPQNGGDDCDGPSQMEQHCQGDTCSNGGWGEWSDYGSCCDRQKTRTRECLAPGGVGCEGESSETVFCVQDTCEKTYVPNFTLGKCVSISMTDNSGDVSKTFKEAGIPLNALRYNNGHDCCNNHFNWNYDICMETAQFAVDGGWGEWSSYGLCCKGYQSKYRSCNNPAPKAGGLPCAGPSIDTVSCFPNECNFASAAPHQSMMGTYMAAVASIALVLFRF